MEYTERVENFLDCEGSDRTKIHFSKEVEVYAFGVNDKKLASLIPVALVSNYKKDYEHEDSGSTHAV